MGKNSKIYENYSPEVSFLVNNVPEYLKLSRISNLVHDTRFIRFPTDFSGWL